MLHRGKWDGCELLGLGISYCVEGAAPHRGELDMKAVVW